MNIEIVAYNPQWTDAFRQEKERLQSLAALGAQTILHVGSTAIPDQAAKPIIDIFVGVAELREPAYYEKLLTLPEYQYVPTDMRGRHLFRKIVDGVWRYNIHLLPNEGLENRSEIVIRDFLRRHPEYVSEYGAVKEACAKKNSSDMESYTRAKTDFLQKIYDLANAELGLPLKPVWEGDE
ncbi:GrpB family protein [Eubacteriales bacterium OttesenSCG-928-N13]|nr:GrpB family protein [Eubacteriales bacterium OttesenSCG-928-N13]